MLHGLVCAIGFTQYFVRIDVPRGWRASADLRYRHPWACGMASATPCGRRRLVSPLPASRHEQKSDHLLLPAFLNVHWFLDKFGMTGSVFQLVNAALLLAVYVGVRLIFGMRNVRPPSRAQRPLADRTTPVVRLVCHDLVKPGTSVSPSSALRAHFPLGVLPRAEHAQRDLVQSGACVTTTPLSKPSPSVPGAAADQCAAHR